jgi:hypothetical protein
MKEYVEVKVHFHLFLTSTLDRSQWSVPLPDALTLGTLEEGLSVTPEPVWTFSRGEKFLALPGIEPLTDHA